MVLTKKAKEAIENAPVKITGQSSTLPPKERLALSNTYTNGHPVVISAKLPEREQVGMRWVGSRERTHERREFRVSVVDGEVYLRSAYGGMWVSGWHPPSELGRFSYGHEQLVLEKAQEMVMEMQEYSDLLGRKPPTEEEIAAAKRKRDLARLANTARLLQQAGDEIDKLELVYADGFDAGLAALIRWVDEQRVGG